MRTRVKICGLTREADVQVVCQSGADAIGFVFYPPSPRHVSLSQAQLLRTQVPALVSVVALFVNPSAADVHQVIQHVRPDILQFHGDESPSFCAQFNMPYFKAFRVGGGALLTAHDVANECQRYPDAAGWLFDSYSAGYGGSGLSFDAGLLADVHALPAARPVILSGGLRPDNVAGAIRQVTPYAVDVSSGVEEAKGLKAAAKVKLFLQAVQQTDTHDL